jgi:hypothetical protein
MFLTELVLAVLMFCTVIPAQDNENDDFNFSDFIPDLSLDATGNNTSICYCPKGTSYQSKYDDQCVLENTCRFETCAPCPNGQYSGGGSLTNCTACETLDMGVYCAAGESVPCPKANGLACYQGAIVPSLGKYCDPPGDPACKLLDCRYFLLY